MSEIKETLPTIQEETSLTVPGYEQAIQSLTTMPDVNPDVVHAFLDAQERVLDRHAKMAFIKAKHALRKEMPPIKKESINPQTKSKYAKLDAIKKIVDPLLVRHGFDDSYNYEYPEEGVIITTCILTHEEGHETRHSVRITRDNVGIKGTKNKTDVHGDASAMKYGDRLSFCAALGINTTDDDDGNAAGTQEITEQQMIEIQTLLTDTGTDIERFCKDYLKLDSLSDIRASQFAKVKAALQSRKIEQMEKPSDNS